MNTQRGIAALLVIACICILSGSDIGAKTKTSTEAKHPSVARAWTEAQVDALVGMEQVSIYSPAPRENGTPPAECDYIRFLRFKLKSAPADASKADACLIMIPGVIEGANGFEHIARQMVYIAKTQYEKTKEKLIK